jgi:uncharacterized protein DUF3467
MNHRQKISSNDTKIEGQYTSSFRVGYSKSKFLIDFGHSSAENDEMQLHTRIITSPSHAELLLHILRESIEHYEEIHGSIQNDEA